MTAIIWILAAITFYFWGYKPMVDKGLEVEARFIAMVMTYFGLLCLHIRKSIKLVELDTIAMRKTLKNISDEFEKLAQSITTALHNRRNQ